VPKYGSKTKISPVLSSDSL